MKKYEKLLNYFFNASKLTIAYIIVCCKRKQNDDSTVLIGGHKGLRYDDNSRVFYEYLEKTKKYKCYWVCDRNMCDSERERIVGEYLEKATIKTYVEYLSSTFVVYSHSLSTDIAPLANRLLRRKRPFLVNVSHGVEGLKKIEDLSKLEYSDIHLAASNFEKQIKIKNWNIPNSSVYNIGYPRFDLLSTRSYPNKVKNILIMYTWREWLSDGKEFENNYAEHLVSIISNLKFIEYCKDNQIILHYILHPFVDLKNMNLVEANDVVRLYTGDISGLISKCDLLVTDYSSVAWDFVYSNKPVLFNQYDYELYQLKRGSYFDMDKQLGELRYTDSNKLIDAIMSQDVLGSKCESRIESLRFKHFSKVDNKNCQRLLKTIEELKYGIDE
ncbi:CDP-glycerol glycerophosphotransferase family protein [Erysipelothrix rhusiopathiae]|uniref:CDP-glycerol:poly(Glycerophosphate) glycerophosphotransferase n=1 Tax=Erysipelothrix rhusiopathiae TaxID=1648 RepID=A0A6S6I6D4_ERYRH|nr:CDP-glycerol glycerophosphotransferase family protein [Erysipelothrix rhusiopathiae]BCB22710.1 CDP-glycerol:poly(glycerophosphate) glycerophosphotransferase [Erysipelothrix rhusiopathiae]